MSAKILKRVANVVLIMILLLFVGCAQNMESSDMGTMKSMDEKPMMDMQEKKKMDSMGTMDDMKETDSMEKNSDKQMGSMDKMMK